MSSDTDVLRAISSRVGARYEAALTELADAWAGLYRAETYGRPRTGSPAKLDAAALKQAWGERYEGDPGQLIASTVTSRMLAATDHIRATGHVIAADDCGFFATWVTARACLEQLAISFWLSEPEISSRERFGRVMSDRLSSLRSGKRAIDLIASGTDVYDSEEDVPEDLRRMMPLSLDLAKELSEVVAEAETLGYRLNPTRTAVEPPRPTLTSLVDSLLVPGAYSLASGMAHVELWATGYLREEILFEGSRPVSGALGPLTYEMLHSQYLSFLLLTSCARVVKRVTAYFNWDDSSYADAHDRAAKEITKTISVNEDSAEYLHRNHGPDEALA